MPLRTRTRDPEVSTNRAVGKDIWTRQNAITPSRAKSVVGIVNVACTATGLRVEVTTDELHGKPPYKSGGPFFSVKLWHPDYAVAGYTVPSKPITQPNSTTGAFAPGDVWTRRYEGSVRLSSGWAHMSSTLGTKEQTVRRAEDHDSVVNPNNLDSLGPTGWNKLRPKLEKANLMQSILELREAPKMIQGTAQSAVRAWNGLRAFQSSTSFRQQRTALGRIPDLRHVPRPIAEEFLNVQFGWKPFVKDIVAMLDVAVNLEDHIQSTVRRNDTWMKRSWEEEVVSSSVLVHSEGGLASSRITPIQGSDWWQPWTTNYKVYRESVTQVWYEGVFKFYRREFDNNISTDWPAVRRARQTISLLGGNITPTVLYKVTPWTWLADWFGNMGENVQALEDQISGQVAAKYMYLMRHTHDQYRYYTSSQSYDGATREVEAVRRLEVKQRVQSAGHFEFSLRSTPLSGMQLAILGALGITRA